MVAERQGWRRPSCGEGCQVMRIVQSGIPRIVWVEQHDPDVHEAFGRATAAPVRWVGVLRTGPLEIDGGRHEVRVDGRTVALTATEMRMLLCWTRRAGELVTQDELLLEVWGPSYVGDAQRLVHVNLARLRSVLGPAGDLITTIAGVGHRLEVLPVGQAAPPRRRFGGREPLSAWATKYLRCVCCGTVQRSHACHGRCTKCAPNRDGRPLHYGPCAAPPAETDGAP